MTSFGDITCNTMISRSMRLPIVDWRSGGAAPTNVTIGTTPTIEAERFDSTTELLSVYVLLPKDMDTSQDLTLCFHWSLVSAQTDSDTLDVTCDYVAVKKNSTGDGIDKTSTQITGQTTVTTANGLAVGDVYEMAMTISAGDATNPLADAAGLAIEFHLTNTTGVASADFLSGTLVYTALY
jgi:hypothetical protein